MSLPATAQHLASYGRGDDSLLVHMTPREVAGLEALALQHYGTGLTTNPDTGLPEAGLLGKLLPAIAGIGLSLTGIGAPMAGLMVGGGTALATGSLQKGLMAGLGAFGGAGLGEGIAGMGASAATSSATASAAPSAASVPVPFTPSAAGAVDVLNPAFDTLGNVADTGASSLFTSPTTQAPLPGLAGAGVPAQTVAMPAASELAPVSQMDKMRAGIGAIGEPGSWDNFIAAQGGNGKALMNGMLAFGPALTTQPGKIGQEDDKSMIRPYDYDPRTQRFTPRTPVPARDFQHFAEGGMPVKYNYDPANQTFTRVNPTPATPAANAVGMGGMGGAKMLPYPADHPFMQNPHLRQALEARGHMGYDPAANMGAYGYAEGGLPGLLRGPGDGVSDSIPAMINGQQPAALGDGEYVVPARVVSELGNGSTDAGARRLDEMVRRVQRARAGTTGSRKAVARDSGAHRMLPA